MPGGVQPKPKVCVIGAGAAGLAMLKELASYPNEFEPIAFDINSDIGGLWIYSDDGDLNKHGLPTRSAVYQNLRTNAPKILMTYPDYQKFGGENRSCVRHKTVLNYLHNYTDHFNIRSFIRFDTMVEKVSRVVEDDWKTTRWDIRTKDLNTGQINVTTCNAVIIATGRNFKRHVPKISGMDHFPGRKIHSHAYRRPEDFYNQTVVLLGAGTSAGDIAVDLSRVAKKIYLSHRHDNIKGTWPINVIQVREVVSANSNELTLQDGSTIVADSLIYCTGYVYDFPFLDENTGINCTDKYIHPVYEHMINAQHPTMSFLGLPKHQFLINFPSYYIQAKYIVALLRGRVKLPKLAKRLEESHTNHCLGTDEEQWIYYKKLADAGGFETLPDYYRQALEVWRVHQLSDWPHFKNNDMVYEDGKFFINYNNVLGFTPI